MRKILAILLVLSLAFTAVGFCGVSEKVEKLIGTNQANLERTYYPRDQRPNQLAIKLGPPLFLGVEYTYNVMPALGVNVGVGTLVPGFSADLGVIYYILPTTFTPYLRGGICYLGNFTQNIIAANLGAGLDIALDNTIALQIGVDWAKSLSNAGAPFQNAVYNGDVNWFNISGGVGFRF